MKKLYTLLSLVILLPVYATAQTKMAKNDSLKAKYLEEATKIVVDVDDLADQLSVFVSQLKSSDPFNSEQWNKIDGFLGNIQTNMNKMQAIPLYDYLKAADQHNFNAEYYHFKIQAKLVNSSLAPFKKYIADTVYTAQIDHAETRIEHFLSATANFKQYLQSLGTVSQNDVLLAINSLRQYIDSLNSRFQRPAGKKDSCRCQPDTTARRRLDSIRRNLDSVRATITPVTISYRRYAFFTDYNDNMFGLAYQQMIGGPGTLNRGNYFGLEILIPIASDIVKKPGGFLLYGLRDNKLLLQAGAGYLKNNQVTEHISWKAGLVYTPRKFGLGFCYSPLTGAGIQLAYRW